MSSKDIPKTYWGNPAPSSNFFDTSDHGNNVAELRLAYINGIIYEWVGVWTTFLSAHNGNNLVAEIATFPNGAVIFRGSLDVNYAPELNYDVSKHNLTVTSGGSAVVGAALGVVGSLNVNGKLGFYGVTPADQYTPQGADGFSSVGIGDLSEGNSLWTGDIPGYNYSVGDIVKALKIIGILAM